MSRADALHPVVTEHRAWKRYSADVAKLDEKIAAAQGRVAEAEAAYADELARWHQALDDGRAGPRPEYHPPADMAGLQRTRMDLRGRRRQVLAEIHDDADRALRAREAELLDEAAPLVEELDRIRGELAEILETSRAITAAAGATVANTALPSRVDLADLVQLAATGDRLLPVDVIPREPPPPPWTHDVDDARPLAGRRRR